jgi:MFS family permease
MVDRALSRGRAHLGFLAIGLGVLAPAMDTSVNIAMPSLTAAFDLTGREIQWVVICYMLTYGSLMLTCGKIGDLFGHRRVLLSGLSLSTVAFTICAMAQSYGVLMAGRALQGVGIALTMSCAPAIATALYSESERTWVLSIYGAIFAIGTALGPLLGSALIAEFGWSGVFLFRAPLALAALLLAWRGLVAIPPATEFEPKAAARFDWLGAGLLVVWMSALMLAFSGPHAVLTHWPAWTHGLPEGVTLSWLLFAFGMLALAAFIAHESRTREPIIRLALFVSPRFAALNVMALAVNLASFSTLLIVPYFLIVAVKLPVQEAGLVMTMSGIGMAIGSLATGWLARSLPAAVPAIAGAGLAGLMLLVIGQWSPLTTLLALASTNFLQGFGVGLFQVAYNDSVIATLPIEDRGVAGSLTMMVRTLGIIGGATGISALFAKLQDDAVASGVAYPGSFQRAFEETLTMAGSGLLVTVVATLLLARAWRWHRQLAI